MTHQATVELLSRFLDGDVNPDERRRVEALIDSDGEAREIYEGLSRVRGSLGQLQEAAPPTHLGLLVQRRIALEAESTGVWHQVDRRLRQWLLEPILLPAFAVVLALAAMFYVLANGLARSERHEPLFLSAPPPLQAPEAMRVDGREFVLTEAGWVDAAVSAEDGELARTLVVPAPEVDQWIVENPELVALVEMGTVVLERDGEIVRLVFETGDG